MEYYTAIDERKLLLRLREGDYGAFDELYLGYASVTLSKLKKMVHIPGVAEELHQDVFMKIWDERATIPLDVPFKAIVFRKAKSLTYNFYRKAGLDKKLHEQLISASTEMCHQVEEHVYFTETNAALMAAIDKLPIKRKKIFTSIKLEGKSYEEASQEFEISLSTIKDHMARALKFLRSQLPA